MKNNFTLYLQSKPNQTEARLVKKFMIEQWKQSSVPEVNPQNATPTGMMRGSASLVSLLTDNSGVHDSQLAYYAKVIENTLKKSASQMEEEVDGASELDR